MKKIVSLLLGIALLGVVVVVMTRPENPSSSAVYSNQSLGLEFSYPQEGNGYVLEERGADASHPQLLKTLILMRAEDRANIPVGGEGPPTITIYVLKNDQKQQPGNWAKEHVMYSNYNLKIGDDEEVTVGGANAVRYSADGLYPSTVVVAAHGENIYVFSGSYLEKDSQIYGDFSHVLQSVEFIRTGGQD